MLVLYAFNSYYCIHYVPPFLQVKAGERVLSILIIVFKFKKLIDGASEFNATFNSYYCILTISDYKKTSTLILQLSILIIVFPAGSFEEKTVNNLSILIIVFIASGSPGAGSIGIAFNSYYCIRLERAH